MNNSKVSNTKKQEDAQSVNEVMRLLSGDSFNVERFQELKNDIRKTKDEVNRSIFNFLDIFDYEERKDFNKSQENFVMKCSYGEYNHYHSIITKSSVRKNYGRVIYSKNKGIENVDGCIIFVQEAMKYLSNKAMKLNEELSIQKDISEQIKSVL